MSDLRVFEFSCSSCLSRPAPFPYWQETFHVFSSFPHPIQVVDLMLGKIGGRRRRGWQRMRWLNWITNSMDMNSSKLWEIVEDRGAWQAAAHGVAEGRTQLRPNFRSHPAWETVHLWHLAPSLKCLGHCWVVRSQHLASGGLNHRCTTYQGSRADYFTSLSLGHLFYKTGTIKKLPL